MKSFLTIFLTAIIASTTTAFFIQYLTEPSGTNFQPTPKTESAYERVLRTGKIKCAYGLWDPAVMKDPNTDAFSGLIYDFMQEVGRVLNMEVLYETEVPWGQVGVELRSGKIDAHCAGIFATPARGKVMAFSNPLFFSPTVAFSRVEDTRFDYNLKAINTPNIRVALTDDDIANEIYEQNFANATTYKLPQLVAPEELLLAVEKGKADVTFTGPSRLPAYELQNPGKIKIIPTKKPLRIFANSIAVDIREQELLHMFNTAINQLIDSGFMDTLIEKYEAEYNMDFLTPVTRPYSWE